MKQHSGKVSRDHVVDALFAVGLTLLGLVGFKFSFGRYEYLAVGVIAALLAAALASVIIVWRLPGLFGLTLSVIAYLVFGAAVAMRDDVVAGFLPTPDAFVALVDGSVGGWRRLLTTVPPSGSFGNLLAVPFILGYVPVLASTLLARRTKWLLPVVVPPAAVLALSVLFGGRRPFSLVLQGALFVTGAIAWLVIRRARERRVFIQTSGRSRLLSGAVMLGLTGVVGFGLAPHLPLANAEDRYVFDRDNPPFDPRQFGSPLNAYGRYLNGDLKDDVMFTVSGVPKQSDEEYGLVRLATLDDYDGVVWEVDPQGGSQAYEFLRVGESVPTDAVGQDVTMTLEVGALPGVWVPTTGTVTGIRWTTPGERAELQRDAFRLSLYSQTAADPVPGGLTSGDSYVLSAVASDRPPDAELRTMTIDPSLRTKVDGIVPDSVRELAGEIVKGKTNQFEQAQALSDWFHQNGYYTDGTDDVGQSKLLPGHSAARLAAFLESGVPVGSSEQYAAAMALMARTVGLPARVVMGFRVEGSDAVDVEGSQVDAWVEIPFTDDAGTVSWVRFDPTPRERKNKPPDQKTKTPKPKFESQDVPPPPVPPPPPDVAERQTTSGKKPPAPKKDAEQDPTKGGLDVVLLAVSAAVGLPLLALLTFSTIVLLLKRRRSRRRRAAPVASTQVAGGWDDYIDTARDIGLPIPARSTRSEVALMVGAGASRELASMADLAVFGPGDPEEAEVAGYWDRVRAGKAELRAELSVWRRVRAQLSLTSLRASS